MSISKKFESRPRLLFTPLKKALPLSLPFPLTHIATQVSVCFATHQETQKWPAEEPINEEEQTTNVTNDVQYVCESSSLCEKSSDDLEEDSPHEIHYSEILHVDTM